jgi:hypothetical protein
MIRKMSVTSNPIAERSRQLTDRCVAHLHARASRSRPAAAVAPAGPTADLRLTQVANGGWGLHAFLPDTAPR